VNKRASDRNNRKEMKQESDRSRACSWKVLV